MPCRALIAALLLPLALMGCAEPGPVRLSSSNMDELPPMRWTGIDDAQSWTRAVYQALETHGAPLIETVPADIDTWCPTYPEGDAETRAAFWAGLLSTLAKHESTWNPQAVGGGGLWYGLVQIAPPTARGYGCKARTGDALKDGADNLACAVRIMAVTVPRDGVVSQGMRGVAADWGPFHSERKRADMIAWSRAQPWCSPPAPARLARLR